MNIFHILILISHLNFNWLLVYKTFRLFFVSLPEMILFFVIKLWDKTLNYIFIYLMGKINALILLFDLYKDIIFFCVSLSILNIFTAVMPYGIKNEIDLAIQQSTKLDSPRQNRICISMQSRFKTASLRELS